MVSCDNVSISDTMHIVFPLEHIQHGIIDRALKAEHQEEEEDSLFSQVLLNAEPMVEKPQNI